MLQEHVVDNGAQLHWRLERRELVEAWKDAFVVGERFFERSPQHQILPNLLKITFVV